MVGQTLPGGRRCPPSTLRPVIPVRDDLRALEGYHSAQVDVRVRLNTNESPEPPPAAFRDAVAAEVSRVDWHRYPDRAATELREAIAATARRRPGAGVRRQRIQRGAADRPARLRRPGPHRRHVRADVPDARPDRPGHRGDGRRGRARRRLHARSRRGRAGDRRAPARTWCSSPRRTTRPGLVEPAERVEQLLDLAPGLVVVDEAYAQFADWSALDLVDEDRPARGHPHVLEDLVDGRAPGSATSSARRGSSPNSTRSCCRTTSTRSSRSPAGSRCGTPTT